jgi:outer membrane protein assembly factor BamB
VVGRRVVVGRVGVAFGVLMALLMWSVVPAGSLVLPARVSFGSRGATGPTTDVDVDFPSYMHDAGHAAFSPAATAIAATTGLSSDYVFQESRVANRPRPGFYSTPLVLHHVMYIGSDSGEFYAIDLNTGSVIWKEFLGFEAKATCRAQGFFATAASGIDPTSGALTIYAASGDGNVYAVRASDGTILWASPVNVPTPGTNDHFNFSSPEIANGKIYIGIASECEQPSSPITIRGGLAAIDQATGNRIATYYTVPDGSLGGSVWTSPAIAPDGSVIVTTGNGLNGALVGDAQSIVRLDPNTLQRLDGYQVVNTSADSDFGGSPTVFTATSRRVSTPMVGACNKDGFYYAWKLYALSAGPVWKVRIASHQHSTGDCDGGAIWDGTNLYVGGCAATIGGVSYRGSIRKLNPANGHAIWVTGLPESIRTSPTLDGAGAIAATSFDTTSATNTAFVIDAHTGTYRVVDDGNMLAASSPVFADQDLVIATIAGSIYTYQAAPPDPPTAVTASAENQAASVTWNAPDDNGSPITSYTVTASPDGATATVPGTQTNATVAGLTNGIPYTFTVTATNTIGTGPASDPSNSVVPADVPGAPTGASAVAGPGSAQVSFVAPDANGSPITNYTVSATDLSDPTNGGQNATDVASPITVTGLTNGDSYTFTVTATNTIGTGPPSDPSNSVAPGE